MATKKKKSTARKTSTKLTRVYSYGVPFLTPEVKKVVQDQLFKANQYRNKLVELEIDRRNRFREIRKTLSTEMERLETEYENLQKEYEEARLELSRLPTRSRASARQKAENKFRENSPQLEKCREIKKKMTSLWGEVKAERERVKENFFTPADTAFANKKKAVMDDYKASNNVTVIGPHNIARINKQVRDELVKENWPTEWKKKDELEVEHHENARIARKSSGCFSGVYLAVEEAAKRSFSDSIFNPRFTSFSGEGKVGIQAPKGMTLTDAVSGKSGKLKVEFPNTRIRKGKQAGIARIMLGRKKGEKPVFIDVNFVYHREMPKDSVIKWAYLEVKKIGLRYKYEIQFTIESEEFSKKIEGLDTEGTIAVNLGWRRLKDRIVIASTWDGANTEEVSLPISLMSYKYDYYKHLLSVSDILFDTVKNELKTYLKENNIQADESLKFDSISQWRAHSKLARASKWFLESYAKDIDVSKVWLAWKRHQNVPKKEWKDEVRGLYPQDLFVTDSVDELNIIKDTLFAWFETYGITQESQKMALYLEWWRRKDEHLITVARNVEARLKKHIREIYRVHAAKWAKKYEFIILEDWNKAKTAENPGPEFDNRTQQEERANAIRQFCGVSVFTDALKNAFGKDRYFERSPKGISSSHFKCGGEPNNNDKYGGCKKCGKMYDRDVSAAMHLWHGERSGGGKTTGSARKNSAA